MIFMKYHLLTWDDCYNQAKEVARQVRRSGFYPEVIVALARSGYVPGRILSDLLSVDELMGLQVHHVLSSELPGEVEVESEYEAVIPYKAPLDIKGESTLVVDDIAGIGKSMTAAVQYVESLKPKSLKSATLTYSTESIIRPDFFAMTVSEDDWLLYPWNYFEDFEDLIVKVQKKSKQRDISPEAMSKAIAESFGVVLPVEELRYIMEEIKVPHPSKRTK
jgi:hypoxanthine phosphoribosyltransferase